MHHCTFITMVEGAWLSWFIVLNDGSMYLFIYTPFRHCTVTVNVYGALEALITTLVTAAFRLTEII